MPKKNYFVRQMPATRQSLPALAKKVLGLSFKKTYLLEAALMHPSYRNEVALKNPENFDRLEFFGDSLLNFVVCRKLYRLFPKADEGVLSRLRSILVSRKILSRIAREIGLTRLIKIGRAMKEQGEFSKFKILADSFEALLAAIYFDRGFAKVERFILQHFDGYFDAKRLFRLDPNPKSSLQELSQKHWQKLPIYTHEMTPDGVKTIVTVHKNRKASATAKTRRAAEEKAARLLVREIRQELLRDSKKYSSGKRLRKIF